MADETCAYPECEMKAEKGAYCSKHHFLVVEG